MAIDIQKTKIELIQWLTTLEDESLLKSLLEISRTQKKANVHELTDEERKAIDVGLEDLKNGRVIPHADVKKIYEKWL